MFVLENDKTKLMSFSELQTGPLRGLHLVLVMMMIVSKVSTKVMLIIIFIMTAKVMTIMMFVMIMNVMMMMMITIFMIIMKVIMIMMLMTPVKVLTPTMTTIRGTMIVYTNACVRISIDSEFYP